MNKNNGKESEACFGGREKLCFWKWWLFLLLFCLGKSAYAVKSVTVTAQTLDSSADIEQLSLYQPILKLYATQAGGGANPSITAIKVKHTGTLATTEISKVAVFTDTDGVWDGNETAPVSTTSWSGSYATISGLSIGTNGTYIYITYNIKSSATASTTIDAQIEALGDITIASGTDVSTYPLDSSGSRNIVAATVLSYPYITDMEADPGWSSTSNNFTFWEWGIPSIGPSSCNSSSKCIGTDLDANYQSNTKTSLYTKMIDLTGATSPQLSFYHWYYTESTFDGADLLLTYDNGLSWSVITPTGGYSDASITALDIPEVGTNLAGFSASSAVGWEQKTFDLTTACGGASCAGKKVRFRFFFGSDTSIVHNGYYLDDFRVGEPPTISQIVFITSAQTIAANSLSNTMTIQTQDSSGYPVAVSSATTINLSTTSGGGSFEDCAGTPITSVTIASGSNSASFCYKDTTVGSPTLTAAESPSQGWTDATQIETITASQPDLTLTTSDITFSNSYPSQGQQITISAVIHNSSASYGSQGSIYQNYEAGGDSNFGIYSGESLAQSFKYSSDVYLYKVSVYVYDAGADDSLTVEIQGNSGSNLPSGTVLASATVNSGVTQTWVDFVFSSPVFLSANTTYWIVAKDTGASSGNGYAWLEDTNGSGGDYLNGNGAYNTGTGWVADPSNNDYYFRAYKYPDTTVKFYDGAPPTTQIGTTQTIAPVSGGGGTQTASVNWTATPSGAHTIYVEVDYSPSNITESNETNNEATKNITVSLATIIVNEVMANPNDGASDDWGEYVELYNAGTQDVGLTSWSVQDNLNTDTLIDWTTRLGTSGQPDLTDPDPTKNTLSLPPGWYAVILDPEYGNWNGYNLQQNNIVLSVNDGANMQIGNGLANTTDNANILNASSQTVDSYSWTSNPGQGISFQRDTFRGSVFSTASGTAGALNASSSTHTMTPSEINMQNAAGKNIYASDTNVTVLAVTVPSDAGTADKLVGVRLENAGTMVDTTDVAAVKVWKDENANNVWDSGDTQIGTLSWNAACSCWTDPAVTGTSTGTSGQKIVFTIDVTASPTVGRTFQARLPQYNGLMVESGYHGPTDAAITNTGIMTVATSNPDLALSASDISFSNATPTEGDVITISAIIHNEGLSYASQAALYQNYEAGGDGTYGVDSGWAEAQSFQYTTDVYLSKVSLYIQDAGVDDSLTVEIQTNSGNNLPSGTVLASTTVNSGSALAWVDFVFSSPIFLSANTTYWIVAKDLSAATNNGYSWEVDLAGAYASGNEAANNGSGWTADTAADHYFRLYKYPDTVVKFYDEDPDGAGVQIGSNQIIAPVSASGTETAQVSWNTTGQANDNNIYVTVDQCASPFPCTGLITESTEYHSTITSTNNKNYKLINVKRAGAHLLISEVGYNPVDETVPTAEYIEIYNATGSTITLTNYYISDDKDQYYNVVDNSVSLTNPSSDFVLRFPSGATIAPEEYQVVAIDSAAFSAEFPGRIPTYEVTQDTDGVPNMTIIAGTFTAGSLTNGGEAVILYSWDQASDLVKDVDIVVWDSAADVTTYSPDKDTVCKDGPDAGTTCTTYLADAVTMTAAPTAANGQSIQRTDFNEGTETTTGGNGMTNHDETTEDLDTTFTAAAQDPTVSGVQPSWTAIPSGAPSAFSGATARTGFGNVQTLYIGNSNGNLYALKASDGTERWSFSVGGGIQQIPNVVSRIAYFGATDGKIYAIEDTGASSATQKSWSPITISGGATVQGVVLAYPVSGKLRLFGGASDSKLYSYRAEDEGFGQGPGTKAWETTTLAGVVKPTPSITGAWVYAADEGGEVLKIDISLGTVSATFGTNLTKITGSLVLSGTNLYVGGWNKKFYSIPNTLGAENWVFDDAAAGDTLQEFKGGAWVSGGKVYVGNSNGTLYVINASTGALIWKYAVPNTPEIRVTPVVYNGVVYFGAMDSKLYAVRDNGTSGALIAGWPYDVGAPVTHPISIRLSENKLYYGDENTSGKVYAFPLQ